MVKTHYIESPYQQTYSNAKLRINLAGSYASACGKRMKIESRWTERKDLRLITCIRCAGIVLGRKRK